MSTRLPATTGDDLISFPVLNDQRRAPSAAFTAWSVPSRSPTYTTPPETAGDDSPIPRSPTLYVQRNFPVARSRAIRPLRVPTKTAPFAIAAEDSTASPAS